MRWDCVEAPLSRLFYRLGKCIARQPLPFLLIPVLLSGLLAFGFYRITFLSDIEYLFTPENGPAKFEREIVYEYFGKNDTGEFNSLRLPTSGYFIRLLVEAKTGSILEKKVFEEILKLDDEINNISVQINGHGKRFRDLCAVYGTECADNIPIFDLLGRNPLNLDIINLTYPLYRTVIPGLENTPLNLFPFQRNLTIFLGGVLGGVKTNSKNEIVEAKALQMIYYLKNDTDRDRDECKLWIKSFTADMRDKAFSTINVGYFTSETLENEIDKSYDTIFVQFLVAFILLISFSVLSCLMFDGVYSKPILAISGVISAALAIAASFGLILLCGVPLVNIVATSPLLILGIGVDGTFVMLSAWRHTDVHLSYEERVGQTFSEAAVSVTITSLTDALAFGVGAITYYPSVRIFCLYTGVAVVFAYVYQITFFGACLALTGKRESKNRHWLICCKQVHPATDSSSLAYNLCCAGGRPEKKSSDALENDASNHKIMYFFQEIYGPLLMKPLFKMIALLIYTVYIGGAIYGCLQVKEGMEQKTMAEDGSYAIDFFNLEDKYGKEYGPSVSIIITQTLDYGNVSTQNEIEDLLEQFESRTDIFTEKDKSMSWLRDFVNYSEKVRNDVTSENFTDMLRNHFLKEPAFTLYKSDIVFSNNSQDIVAARFMVFSRNMTNSSRQMDMMITARNIAEESKFNVTVYNPAFIFYDQYATIITNTLQNVGIATASMLVIALILIPSPVSTIWVFLSIVSISTGVIGYMSLWDVNFDSIAMFNIIMCIGFCVDFSAHISYMYSICKNECPNDRVCTALGNLGYPILQGALSTICGVLVVSFATFYFSRVFFKIVFLVIVIATFHGICLLPVLLALTGRRKATRKITPTEETYGVYVLKNSPIPDPETGENNNYLDKNPSDT